MTFERITVLQAEALIAQTSAHIFDVRDPDSYRRGHVPGAENVSVVSLSLIIETTPRTTPIVIYCYHGFASQEYAQIFTDFGFRNVYSVDGGFEAWRGFLAAANKSRRDALDGWLVTNGFAKGDIDARADNATTPLMRASQHGDIAIIRALLASGADLDARNADGNNALWLACVGDHPSVVDSLIAAGIPLDNANDNGATALMYAASTGKPAIVARLLAAGADPHLASVDGFTALDMAADIETLKLLRSATSPKRPPVACASA